MTLTAEQVQDLREEFIDFKINGIKIGYQKHIGF